MFTTRQLLRTKTAFKSARFLATATSVQPQGQHPHPHAVPVDGFIGAIGNTPLIRINSLSNETGCEILGKAEFMNPGGSVKDRAAWGLVQWAEKNGKIKPGGTICEGTAGNTGIGLAHVCRARGYKLVIYMPNTQSQEKIDLLRMLGAEVHPVPVVAFDHPMNFNNQAKRHAEGMDNAAWVNQFDNAEGNRAIHITTTGPEIYAQTSHLPGGLDAFICSTGTGGTLAGITSYLKEKSEGKIQCWLADPPGSALEGWINRGTLVREGGSITEGIGQGRITDNLKADIEKLDGAIQIPDSKTIAMIYHLLQEDGIYLGASSALNVVAAKELAIKLGKGSRVVTILCDGAYRYQSRLFSRKWLESKNLVQHIPEHLQKLIVLP